MDGRTRNPFSGGPAVVLSLVGSAAVKIESQVRISAPAHTVFDFFAWLDHLRLMGTLRRREWCTQLGRRVALGESHDLVLVQGRHRVRLRFTTEELEPGARIVDVFTTWPLAGARRTLLVTSEAPQGGAPVTRVLEADEWRPPIFVRALVDRRLEQQQAIFQERLEIAAKIIEEAFARFGADAFSGGVLEPARALGFLPDGDPEVLRAGAPG